LKEERKKDRVFSRGFLFLLLTSTEPLPMRSPGRETDLLQNRDPSHKELLQRIEELEQEIDGLRKESAALRDREIDYRFLSDSVKDFAWEVSTEGLYTHVNHGGRELIGYGPEEILGRPLGHFMPPAEAEAFRKRFQEYLSDLSPLERLPAVVLHRDGTPVPVEISAIPIFDSEGTLICYRGIHCARTHSDIVQRALRESESRFRVLFESTMNGIYLVDQETRRTRMVNSTFCRMLGYSEEEMEQLRVDDIHPPKDLPHVLREFQRLVDKEIASASSIPVKRKDGSVFLADISAIPIRVDGRDCVAGLFQDVTDQRRIEDALARSELIHRTTIDAMDDLVHVVGSDLKITLVNRTFREWCLRLGLGSEPLGRQVREVFPFLPEEVLEEYRQVFLSGETLVTEETTSLADEEIITETRKIPVLEDNRVVRVMTLVRDVTDRRLWERELEESEERFRALFEGSLDAIFLTAPETGIILDVNPAGEELIVLPRDRIVGLPHYRLFPDRVRDQAKKAFQEYVQDREEVRFVELPVLRSNGTEAPVEILAQILQIKGVPVVYGAFRDISKRREAQEALRMSEQKYRTLYENLRDASATVDMAGNIEEFNAVFADMLGYRPEEVLRLNIAKITPRKWRPIEEAILENQVRKRGYSDVYEKEYMRKDGVRVPVEMRSYLIRDESGDPRGMWAIIRDISGRKKMETELMRVQTLDSLGTLAGGIAHDFNNLLAAILNNISFVRRYGDLSEDLNDALSDAEKVTMRARGLTYQLLSFAKGGEPVKKTVSVSKIIRETAAFALSGSNVKCDFELPEDLWMVDADPGQLGQVIQNLIINADQAMPGGGMIRVRAANETLGDREVSNLEKGRYVSISLQDTGHGIPRKQLSKIFDLFFSTKGRGRGLGLATAFMAVKRHNGHIQAESRPGRGTTFQIHLPASRKRFPDAEDQKEAPPRGSGRILLIDDEQIIRKSAGRVLQRLGYQVALASDGREGLDLYEKGRREGLPFDVVIVDLTIPGGMGGREMIQELKQSDPEARVIVSSGYSEDPIMSDHRSYGVQAVVAKPYRIEILAETIRSVLDDR